MGLETGRSRRLKNSIKSSSTVLCDPVACIEDWKQQIKVKRNIPENQQRLTFTSHVLNKETVALANFTASRQWQIVVDASADDLCKHFQSWRAHIYSKNTYAELFCSLVLKEDDDPVFPLQSKTAEELRQIGVPCNVFYLTFDKWIPNWKGGISGPVAVEGHPETITLQVDDQLQQDTFCIELYGCLDGLSLPMPLRYVMNGGELTAKLLMIEQTANYRAEQKVRYQLTAPISKVLGSSEKAPEEEKHLSELKRWNLYLKDYIVHFEKKCEFTAIISQDHRQLRCIVLPVITIPVSADKVNKEHLIYKLLFDRSKEPSSEVLALPSTSQSPSTVLSSSDKVCVSSSVEKNDGKVTKKRKKRKPRKSAKRKMNSTEHQNGEQREVDLQDRAFEEESHVPMKAPHMPYEAHHSTMVLRSPSFMAGYSGVGEIEVSSGQCSKQQESLHIQKMDHEKSLSQQSKLPVSLAEVKGGDCGLTNSIKLVGADLEHTKEELVGADSESAKQDFNQFSTNVCIQGNGMSGEIASLVSNDDNSSCSADVSVSVLRKEGKPKEGQEICYCKGDSHTIHGPNQTNVSHESGQDAYVGLRSDKRMPTFATKNGTHTCNTCSIDFSDNLSCNTCSIAFSGNLSDRRLIDEPRDIPLVTSDLSSNQQVDNLATTSGASANNAVQSGAKFSEMGKKMDVGSQHDKSSQKCFSTLLGNTDQLGITNPKIETQESRGHVMKLSQGARWNRRSPESQVLHFNKSSNQDAYKSFRHSPSFSHWKHPRNDLQTSQMWPRTVYPKQENLPLVDGGFVSRIRPAENFLSWDQVPNARCSFKKQHNLQLGPSQIVERENKFPLVPSSTLKGHLCNSHDRLNERTGRFGEALLQHERGSKTNEITLQQGKDCVVDEAKKSFNFSKVVSSLDRTLHQSCVNSRLTQATARGSRIEGGSDSEPAESCLEKHPLTSPAPDRSLRLSCFNWSNSETENICKKNQEGRGRFECGQGHFQKGGCKASDMSSGSVIATASAADITKSRPDHASCNSEKDLLEIKTIDYAGETTSNKEIKFLLSSILDAINSACESQAAYEQVASATGFPLCEFDKVAKAVSPTFKATQATLHPWSFTGCCCVRSMAESCRSANLQTLADVPLSSLWKWYEEPSCFGLEVKLVDWHGNSTKEGVGHQYQGFFVPYLSGMQLFRRTGSSEHQDAESAQLKMKDAFDCSFLNQPIFSILLPKPKLEDDTKILCRPELELEDPNSSRRENRESMNSDCHNSIFEKVKQCECNAKLLYEFFEGEKPPQRKPFSDRIQQLVMGHVAPESSNFGDGHLLDSVRIGELHPASWFAVAWYPIYRIPDGAFRSAFLTYHSLSCLRLDSSASNDSCRLSNSLDSFTAPVVGLMSYSAQAEDWFTVGPQHKVKEFQNDTPDLNPSHVLNQYVTRLEATAAAIANSSNSTSKHMDYSFFLSRRR